MLLLGLSVTTRVAPLRYGVLGGGASPPTGPLCTYIPVVQLSPFNPPGALGLFSTFPSKPGK